MPADQPSTDQTALVLLAPAVDPVVGRHRSRLDAAAQLGVPAHVTLVFPFAPASTLTPDQLERLREIALATPAFTLDFASTAWFGEQVLYLAPEPASSVLSLQEAVVGAFPDYPPYGGAHAESVPHLTVGHDQPVEQLRIAETAVLPHLPVTQEVSAMAMWSGSLTDGAPWRQVGSFPLG
jgi:2'-5' RNA ligase